jgi:hypothetical protein
MAGNQQFALAAPNKMIEKRKQVLFCVISLYSDLKFYTTFQIYAIVFGLMQFGIDDLWPHLSSVGG